MSVTMYDNVSYNVTICLQLLHRYMYSFRVYISWLFCCILYKLTRRLTTHVANFTTSINLVKTQ